MEKNKVEYQWKPKLSIIVAVYNVSQFLKRCVDSILNQDFVNFEVLLIDDGSDDGSGELCDQYAQQDRRVRTFHKANGGAASAKNYGLKKSLGKYIGFVDSDDWIESTMYKNLMDIMEEREEVDISIGSYKIENENGEIVIPYNSCFSKEMSGKEALVEMFLEHGFNWSLWDKVYKRELFVNDMLCDEWIMYGDDTAANWELFHRAQVIYYKPILGYHYCMRAGSLVHQSFSKKNLTYIEVLKNIYYQIKNDGTELELKVKKLLISFLIEYIFEMIKSKIDYRSIILEYQNLLSSCMIGEDVKSWDEYCYSIVTLPYDDARNYLLKQRLEFIKNIKSFCGEYKKNYIYGAGKIAGRIAKILDAQGISYSGFIVSSLERNPDIYYDKKVICIKDILPSSSLGIILGIQSNDITLIMSKLDDMKLNYFDITPYYRSKLI